MEIFLAVFITLSNLICLIVGVKVGAKAYRGEEIKVPNPVQKAQEVKASNARKETQETFDTMMYNIDVYDGTSLGQKEL